MDSVNGHKMRVQDVVKDQAWTIQGALYSHGSSMGLRVYQRQTFLNHRQRQAFTVKNVSIG